VACFHRACVGRHIAGLNYSASVPPVFLFSSSRPASSIGVCNSATEAGSTAALSFRQARYASYTSNRQQRFEAAVAWLSKYQVGQQPRDQIADHPIIEFEPYVAATQDMAAGRPSRLRPRFDYSATERECIAAELRQRYDPPARWLGLTVFNAAPDRIEPRSDAVLAGLSSENPRPDPISPGCNLEPAGQCALEKKPGPRGPGIGTDSS
jgi:hypothetical protein